MGQRSRPFDCSCTVCCAVECVGPAGADVAECVAMPAAERVLTKSGVRLVTSLSEGDELIPGRSGHGATVRSVRVLPSNERRLVTLHVCGGVHAPPPLTVTASHVVMVRQKHGQRSFRPCIAAESQPGDLLRTHKAVHSVSHVEPDLLDTAVVEVELCDVRGSFFVGGPAADQGVFFEVCGASAPLDGAAVWLIRFDRYGKFRDVFLENPELASSRRALEDAGWNVDLGAVHPELGPAKLLVRPAVVPRVLRALQQRFRESREVLRLSDVIVADECKTMVLDEVRRLGPGNRIRIEEVLELGPEILSRHTFAELSGSSWSGVTATQSSTDAHLGWRTNPRKRAAPCPW